jgi:tartrate dehydratase beta subunit/fumarate hydratase class I family protein
VKRLYVEDLPLVVCNDAAGGDLFSQGRAAWCKTAEDAV